MAITRSGDAPGADAASHKQAAKLPEDFQPNEPTHKSGIDKDGKPDDSLSPNQLGRAATEALLALRPQPEGAEVKAVLNKLSEIDDKGQPKVKCKTAKEAGDKAVSTLNEIRG